MGKPFFVYLLRCADGSYYVGQTDELEHRLAEHQAGQGCEYTRKRVPVELVWKAEFTTREEAKEMEARLKGWSRAKKRALIDNDWELISKLGSRGAQGRAPFETLAYARSSGQGSGGEPTDPEEAEGRHEGHGRGKEPLG